MTEQEQLEKWLNGESVHVAINHNSEVINSEYAAAVDLADCLRGLQLVDVGKVTPEQLLAGWQRSANRSIEELRNTKFTMRCCPDFSCCHSDMQWHKLGRERFFFAYKNVELNRDIIDRMLTSALNELIVKKIKPGQEINITRRIGYINQ